MPPWGTRGPNSADAVSAVNVIGTRPAVKAAAVAAAGPCWVPLPAPSSLASERAPAATTMSIMAAAVVACSKPCGLVTAGAAGLVAHQAPAWRPTSGASATSLGAAYAAL